MGVHTAVRAIPAGGRKTVRVGGLVRRIVEGTPVAWPACMVRCMLVVRVVARCAAGMVTLRGKGRIQPVLEPETNHIGPMWCVG